MIDNIFTSLTREKTPGVIIEFVLWCTVCLVTLLSIIALAVGGGHVTWILMMLFSIGLAVLMAFRLKAILMLYSVGVFNLLLVMIHYLCLGLGYSYYYGSHSPLNIIFFIFALLLSLAAVVCACVQFFTRYRLGTVLTILVLVDSAVTMLLQILMYTSEFLGYDYANSEHRYWMNTRGYWPGTIAFWILLAVIAVYYACFFWGPIDNRKGKIIGSFGATNRLSPGIQEIRAGQYGRVWYLQGRTVTIGSGQEANISLNDPSGYLSRIHCSIRFNPSTGFYEVLDQSNSGTWVMNGGQLQPGVYSSVRRGSVLSLGSTAQQFRLL